MREHVLKLLNAGRITIEATLAIADISPRAPHTAWLTCQTMLTLARWFNEAFPEERPITPDDHLTALMGLRCELLRRYSFAELEEAGE